MIRPSQLLFPVILLIAVVFSLGSCTVQKRRYRDGFYVQHSSQQAHQSSNTLSPKTSDNQLQPTVEWVQRNSNLDTLQTTAATLEQPIASEPHHYTITPPDTFIIEEPPVLTRKQRIKFLLKNKQDENGLLLIPEAKTADSLAIGGIASVILWTVGGLLGLIALIYLIIAMSKWKNAPEGYYSPDNVPLMRRALILALISFLLPTLLIFLLFLA